MDFPIYRAPKQVEAPKTPSTKDLAQRLEDLGNRNRDAAIVNQEAARNTSELKNKSAQLREMNAAINSRIDSELINDSLTRLKLTEARLSKAQVDSKAA